MTVPIPLEWLVYPSAAFLVYLPALNGPPIFDDIQVMQEVRAFHPRDYLWRFNYRILTLLSFWLQKVWPGTIRSMHAGNMVIHSVNGLLVNAIASAIGGDYGFAFLSGLVFVIHPFAVNSVGYITGRASILSAMFGLGAVLVALSGYGLLALPLLFCSYLSKEDGVGFVPLVLVGLIWKGL